MTKDELITRLKALSEETQRIKLKEIEIDEKKRHILFKLVCDRTLDENLKKTILEIVNEAVPDSFKSVDAEVIKVVADGDLVQRAVYEYLISAHSSVSYQIEKEDIAAQAGEVFKYSLRLTPHMVSYFNQSNLLEKLNRYLDRHFCNIFSGELLGDKEETPPEGFSEKNVTAFPLERIRLRNITIEDIIPIDDRDMSAAAVYMSDMNSPALGVVIAGNILSIEEKKTKNDKPFFLIEFTDKTAILTGRYFSKKNTLEKIRELKAGDGIITEGDFDYFKNSLNYTVKKINRCTFPEDFKPVKKEKRTPQESYSLIFPERYVSAVQSGLFEATSEVPECLLGKTFVVMDFETTGTYPATDGITEIGAVKIEDGKVIETFCSLINPGQAISEYITGLTGIDNEMVKDAPQFKDVLPDFYKFSYGAAFVAHNIEFDYRFLTVKAREAGYDFDNPGVDTLSLSRELLPELANHKLNTAAGHFGIEFRHHRALSDAVATAELFLELIKMKKCLPKL